MDSVHVSQFFPCSKINYACELYYVCELSKYLYYNYNSNLSLDGVILVDSLKKSNVWEYLRVAIDEGWICETSLPEEDYKIDIVNILDLTSPVANKLFTTEPVTISQEERVRRRDDVEYALRNPLKAQISFSIQDDDYWIWDINGKLKNNFTVNNTSVNDNMICYCFVSLIAYVAVERLKTGKPKNFGIELSSNLLILADSFSYIYILSEYSNCLTGWFFYSFDNSVQNKDK